MYRQTSNISRTLVSNKTVDHSNVVGASPVKAVLNYIFILDLKASLDWAKTAKIWDEQVLAFGAAYIRGVYFSYLHSKTYWMGAAFACDPLRV